MVYGSGTVCEQTMREWRMVRGIGPKISTKKVIFNENSKEVKNEKVNAHVI